MKIMHEGPLLALPYQAALGIGNPLYRSFGRVTFQGATPQAWATWSQEIFSKILYPVLQKSLQYAALGYVRELEDLNEQISRSLADPALEASFACGRQFLLSLPIPRGEKVLKKLAQRVEANPGQGCHFAVAYAARCAAFYFSPTLCTTSYLYQEAWAAFPAATALKLSEYISIALQEVEQQASVSDSLLPTPLTNMEKPGASPLTAANE